MQTLNVNAQTVVKWIEYRRWNQTEELLEPGWMSQQLYALCIRCWGGTDRAEFKMKLRWTQQPVG